MMLPKFKTVNLWYFSFTIILHPNILIGLAEQLTGCHFDMSGNWAHFCRDLFTALQALYMQCFFQHQKQIKVCCIHIKTVWREQMLTILFIFPPRSTTFLALHWHLQWDAGCKHPMYLSQNFLSGAAEGERQLKVLPHDQYFRMTYIQPSSNNLLKINMSFITIDGLPFLASSEVHTWLAEKHKAEWDTILFVFSTNFSQFSIYLRQVLAM